MKIKIAYFSGTGSTRYVAESFKNESEARNHSAPMFRIGRNRSDNGGDYDLLIICYAVHACNAPKPVFDWVKGNKELIGVPTAVISVSGGGEITPNLACRHLLKMALRKERCPVFYEKMIVMPSNMFVSTNPAVIDKLLDVLPYRISFFVNDILKGKTSLSKPGPVNRLLARICMMEHYGAALVGKRIKASEACNGCGLCAKQCPVGNIEMHGGRPEFQNSCTICLQCLYSCPRNALSLPGMGNRVLIKEGYDFPGLLDNHRRHVEIDIKKETRGLIWLGVRRYLLNSHEGLEPEYKEADPDSSHP